MKQRIINWLLSNTVKVVLPEDVIRDVKGTLYLGKTQITPEELKSLVSEVKALERMRIWSILNETIKQLAYEKGWKNSQTMEELNTAKTEFYILEIQASIIKTIRSKAQ